MTDDRSKIKIDLKNGLLEVEGSTKLVESVIPLIKQMGLIILNGEDKDITEDGLKQLDSLSEELHDAFSTSQENQQSITSNITEENAHQPGTAFYDENLSKVEIFYTGIFKYLWESLPKNAQESDLYLLLLYFLMLIDPEVSFSEEDMKTIAQRIGINFVFSSDKIENFKSKDLIYEDREGFYEISGSGINLIEYHYKPRIDNAKMLMKERSSLKFE